MKIAATVRSDAAAHDASVRTDDRVRALAVPGRPGGGSAVNGGELLMLALATCYANDLHREAARLGIAIDAVEVEASATFAGVGLAASDVTYRARVRSTEPAGRIQRLLDETDAVAEVHNTLRTAVAVRRVAWDDGEDDEGAG